MNLRDLRYFVMLAEHQHFGKAAQASFVSQPTLSMQIKKLEEALGIQLFERQKKQVLLTQAGTQLLPYAQQVLVTVDQMKSTAQALTDPLSGTFTLSAIESLAPYLLPVIVPALTKSFPNLKLRLQEGKTNQLLKQLQQGQIDAACLALPVPMHHLQEITLFKEPFYVAVGDKHKLHSHKKPLSLAQIEDEPILLLEEGHCLHDQAIDLCHRQPTQQNDYTAASLETLRYTVAHGPGLTLMPLLACHPTDGIAYHSLQQTSAERTIALVFRDSAPNKALLEAMASIIRQATQPALEKMAKKYT